jgi:plasmid maintenance system antidote protein VapI
MGKTDVRSEMSPERTRRLLAETLAWLKLNQVKQKDLAKMLDMSPQQLTDIFKNRTQLTGEQVLTLQEIIKTKPKKRE